MEIAKKWKILHSNAGGEQDKILQNVTEKNLEIYLLLLKICIQ